MNWDSKSKKSVQIGLTFKDGQGLVLIDLVLIDWDPYIIEIEIHSVTTTLRLVNDYLTITVGKAVDQEEDLGDHQCSRGVNYTSSITGEKELLPSVPV